MSAISEKVNKSNTGKLNTTVDPDVLSAFKVKCKSTGVSMNVILEAFMRQYIDGGFYLKLARDTDRIEVELDDKENRPSTVKVGRKKKESASAVSDLEGDIADNFGEISN